MRIDLPDNKRLVFEMTFPIRWGDMSRWAMSTT